MKIVEVSMKDFFIRLDGKITIGAQEGIIYKCEYLNSKRYVCIDQLNIYKLHQYGPIITLYKNGTHIGNKESAKYYIDKYFSEAIMEEVL